MLEQLDATWIACAERLGFSVARGGEGYVHWDGARLWIADPAALDADDSLAQLVLHELCHFLVEGPPSRARADWGLDNTTSRDAERERAAVRLQAHLAGAWGLRALLSPTTEVRAFYQALPDDALGPPDGEFGASTLARRGAARAATGDESKAIEQALSASVEELGLPLHRASKRALVAGQDSRTCGGCAWRTEGGFCRRGGGRTRVTEAERACAAHEPAPDCLACGACCRDAYDSVTIGARDAIRKLHPELIVYRGGRIELAREAGRCAALDGPPLGPFHCRVYEDRPTVCKSFERSGRHCLTARRRVGLSV
jgi:hypothetical protein